MSPALATSSTPLSPTPDQSAAEAGRIEAILQQFEFSGAVLVARDDQLLYRGALGMADAATGVPNTPETLFKTGSIHKQMDAALVMSLAEDGLIDIEGSICQGIEACPNTLGDITYHQVLTHQSGIGELTDDEASLIDSNEMALRVIGDASRYSEPGESFNYSTTAYSLLSATTEMLTGEAHDKLLAEHVYEPAGLEHTGLAGFDGPLPNAAMGHTKPRGGAIGGPIGHWTSIDDLRHWHRALMDGSVLSPSSMSLMEQRHIEFEPDLWYGYGVELRDVTGRREVFHPGETPGFVGYLIRFPDDDVVIVLLANAESVDVEQLRDLLIAEVFDPGSP